MGMHHLKAGEGEELTDQGGSSVYGQLDNPSVLVSFTSFWQVFQKDLGMSQDRSQDVIEIVSKSSGKEAHSLQFLALEELFLQLSHMGYFSAWDNMVSDVPRVVLVWCYRHVRQECRSVLTAVIQSAGPYLTSAYSSHQFRVGFDVLVALLEEV